MPEAADFSMISDCMSQLIKLIKLRNVLVVFHVVSADRKIQRAM